MLIGHERRRQLVQQITARAGVDLSPAAAWLLARLSLEPEADVDQLASVWGVPVDRARAGFDELLSRDMVVLKDEIWLDIAGDIAAISDQNRVLRGTVTPLGQEAADRLIAARREAFARLLDGWEPERHAEVAGLLSKLAQELQVAGPGLVEAR